MPYSAVVYDFSFPFDEPRVFDHIYRQHVRQAIGIKNNTREASRDDQETQLLNRDFNSRLFTHILYQNKLF